jgi:hypothetical protein
MLLLLAGRMRFLSFALLLLKQIFDFLRVCDVFDSSAAVRKSQMGTSEKQLVRAPCCCCLLNNLTPGSFLIFYVYIFYDVLLINVCRQRARAVRLLYYTSERPRAFVVKTIF